MQPKTPKLLEDIRDAAAFIGEAMKRLARHDAEVIARIGNHRQIIAFRNMLIHGYDLVDHGLVWSTIENQVPALLRDVNVLLGSAD